MDMFLSDGTVNFLPHRLNRQPVVVRGLTNNELFFTAFIAGVAGLIAGIPIAILFEQFALVPSSIVAFIGFGIFIGGSILRRKKRGKPDTWLYRQIQWTTQQNYPFLGQFIGGSELIQTQGYWTTKRLRSVR
ncbi:TIGR03750 family conjugal transfer protein [Zophobihabitans entericus]|uniref:TIGR03750 family conjugal transfer protein n=1 Tax=Zophobihabitans entericus TaxID=1635327 RepID=A0A6G9ICN4_9GAMM|nr:TIGR03750 family conjugal transfer protein [Zophobihabitans entericus]QIQ21464.1 TIGR03750 family conjugal transfer protein [Zophobihabitans entericus]